MTLIFINCPEVYINRDDPKFQEVHGLAEVIVTNKGTALLVILN
jgi:hypothetical protein